MPASRPPARSLSRSASSASQPACLSGLGHDGVVVAAVVGGAAGDQIGEFFGADEIAAPHLQPIELQRLGDAVEPRLDGVVGGRLAEAAHGLLRRLVGGDGDGVIGDRADPVGADDGADGLAELQGRAPGVGADVVDGAHAHGVYEAGAVERQLDIEDALRPMHVAAAHVLEPVLDQLHGGGELARQEAGKHGVLDAALDAVAAADIDVLVHAHLVHGQAQGARDLVGELGHLDRRPHVQHLAPRVPARHHAEGLDRHRGAAPPFDAIGKLVRRARQTRRRHRPRRSAGRAARWSRARDARARCLAGRPPPHRARTAAPRSRRGSSRARPRRAPASRRRRRPPTRRHSAPVRRPADSASPGAHRRRSAADRRPPPARGPRRRHATPGMASASMASIPTMRAQA